MARRTQADLAAALRAAADPAARLDAALALLAATRSRERIDLALGALADPEVAGLLDASNRPPLRDLARVCFERPADDRGGLLRERLLALLGAIGHRDDLDLLVLGCRSYQGGPRNDVLAGLRAAALAALARMDLPLASTLAVRLLGEPETSPMTGQPSLAAIEVLAHASRILPVYAFLLQAGEAFLDPPQLGGEVVGRAFAVVGPALPADLHEELLDRVPGWARDPATGGGVVEGILARDDDARHAMLERALRRTRHEEVIRYAAVLLATTRREDDRALLYRLALEADPSRAEDFAAAVELTSHPDRDALLADLRGPPDRRTDERLDI